MQIPKNDLDALLKTPQGETVSKHKEEILSLMKSQDAQKLMDLLNQNAGGGLKQAADHAMSGDLSDLVSLLGKVMESKEGSAVIGRLEQSIPKD